MSGQIVLVVEDEENLLEALKYNLEREGYDVHSAEDGARGLELARELPPDLIILDVMLPSLDGFEVCRILRRQATMPILMLTAKGEEIDRVVGLELGADDYVIKPSSMRELLARVKQVGIGELNQRGLQMTTILYVCVHNSGRSQMAEAFTRHLSGGRVEAISAGTQPGGQLNPTVVEAMAERGIDITSQRPKPMDQPMVDAADRVYTMGCAIDEACPAVFVPSEDWGLDDPAGQPIETVRRIRDEVEAKVRALLKELGAQSSP